MDSKEMFLELLGSVKREGITDLINFLESSDFFTAPASTKYHNCFEQGLVCHSLNVYFNLLDLAQKYEQRGIKLDPESIIICGLLHDMSKVNFYEETVQNKKVYSSTGSKYDELGKYDWQSVKGYKIKEIQDRFIGLEHCVNSTIIIERFIKLKEDEKIAIMNHHFNLGGNYAGGEISAIFTRYPLAMLLHSADMFATFIDENSGLYEQAN